MVSFSHECAHNHGLESYSFGENEAERFTIVYKKGFGPTEEKNLKKQQQPHADVETKLDKQSQFLVWDSSRGTEVKLK